MLQFMIVQNLSWLFFFFFDKYHEEELLDHIVVLFLIFWGDSILLSMVAASFYISNSGEKVYPFLNIFTNTCYLWDLIIVLIYTLLFIRKFANDFRIFFLILWMIIYLFLPLPHVFLPWGPHEQYEKAKRWTPQVSRCPLCY